MKFNLYTNGPIFNFKLQIYDILHLLINISM